LSIATVDVILHLINSKCLPVGLEVCPLNTCNLWISAVMDSNEIVLHMDECRHFFNFALPSELLCKRSAKFLHKLNAHCG